MSYYCSSFIQRDNERKTVTYLYSEITRYMTYPCVPARRLWDLTLDRQLTDEEWAHCCAQVHEVPFTYRHKLLHFKFLDQFYYTPQGLTNLMLLRHPAVGNVAIGEQTSYIWHGPALNFNSIGLRFLHC